MSSTCSKNLTSLTISLLPHLHVMSSPLFHSVTFHPACLHLVPIFYSPLVWPFWAGWPVWLLERLLTSVTTARLSQFSLLSTRHYLLLHKNNCTAFHALHHANTNTYTNANANTNTTWPLVTISCTNNTVALDYTVQNCNFGVNDALNGHQWCVKQVMMSLQIVVP